MATEKQREARVEVVSVAVTKSEKRAVRAVASALGITDSELLRDQTLDDVLEQYERIRGALGVCDSLTPVPAEAP